MNPVVAQAPLRPATIDNSYAQTSSATTPTLLPGGPELLIQWDHGKEKQYLQPIRLLIGKDLSEPYSIYVYRYFLSNWPNLCWMVLNPEALVDPVTNEAKHELWGVIICKLEPHRSGTNRGYIAMLAVEESQRGRGLGSKLVQQAINTMEEQGADEVVLETEDINKGSLKLYERLGFLPTKHLHRYYLNGSGALRLAYYLTDVKTKLLSLPKVPHSGGERIYPDDERDPTGSDGQYDEEIYG